MGIYTEAVQKLYVAYFNRPADVAGLTYWENVVTAAKGSTAAVSAAFAGSDEYKAAYAGMDAAHVVAQVYQNLFGHGPDTAGLNFWTQALLTKALTVDNVVTGIAAGALGTDATAYKDKVAAATAFTVALDTADKQLAYSGDKANNVGKMFIAGVTDDASLAAATATAALASTIANVVAAAPQVVGTTYTLTAGLDSFPGTAGNDVFNVLAINPTTGSPANNLSAFDVIDGSAGKDTLNIEVAAGKDAAGATINLNSATPTVNNVETINLNQAAADTATLVATTIDASKYVGATVINQIGQATTIKNLAVTTTAGFNGVSTNMNVQAAGASAAVAMTNVAEAATLSVSGSKLAAVTVSGTRADTDGSGDFPTFNLNVTAGKDVQSVAVSTNQATTLALNENTASTKHLTTIDASASTGGVTFGGTTGQWDAVASAYVQQKTVLNVSTGAGDDSVTVSAATAAATSSTAAVNSTISTGAGKDTIVVSTTGSGLTTVDAGAGDDKITLNKLSGAGLSIQAGDGNDTVTLAGDPLETTDIVDGGAGTDTIALGGKAARVADDYIVFNKLLKNFESIKFTTAETALDASKLAANYTALDLFAGSSIVGVGSQAITGNGNVGVTAAGYDASDLTAIVYAGNIALTEKTTGTVTANADVLTMTVRAASGSNTTATLAGDVQTAAVTLTNTVNSSSNPTLDRYAGFVLDNTAADTHLKSLTLSGNGWAKVTNVGGSLTTVDASALGGTLTVLQTTSEGLQYLSSNSKAETIKLGSGIDHIELNASTYGKMDTVIGLNLVLNSAGTALTAASDQLNVGGLTAFNKFTTSQTDLDLALKDAAASGKTNVVFQMGGDTYIFEDKGTIGSVDSADVVVKLVGSVSLDALVVALNSAVSHPH